MRLKKIPKTAPIAPPVSGPIRVYSLTVRGDKAINRYELKKVKSDVFEMIYEAETRGETVFNVFPDGGKAFCDDVVKNCLHKKWYEVLLCN